MLSFFKENGFECYETVLPPKLVSENSIGFGDVSEFTSYLSKENIKSILYSTTAVSADDYYITKDIMKDEIGSFYAVESCSEIIKKEVVDYNKSLDEIDFSNYFTIVFFALVNGFVLYYLFTSNIPILEPHDKFKEILFLTEEKVTEEREQYKKNILHLKQKLKEKILNDPKFYIATNKDLRRIYICDLLNSLDDEYNPLKEVWCGEFDLARRSARDFIESIWSEYKHTSKK